MQPPRRAVPAAAEAEAEIEVEIEAESQISPILNTVLALKFAVHFQKYSVSTGKFDFEFLSSICHST